MTFDIPMPPHAYVPGQNARHPEDWFDPIKAGVEAFEGTASLHLTDAWRAGMVYFENGFFWECHEVLEAVWMQTPHHSTERSMTQAIIQLANARLKLKMGKPRATLRLCDMVVGHLVDCGEAAEVLGLALDEVRGWVAVTRAQADAETNAL